MMRLWTRMTETLTVSIRVHLHRAPSKAMSTVLENDDLLALILQSVELTPRDFVHASRVSKSWHEVCTRDARLALKTARSAQYLTKRALMGLTALSSQEADWLPRATRLRWDGGIMYLYPVAAVDMAWSVVGDDFQWHVRLQERSRNKIISRSTTCACRSNRSALLCPSRVLLPR